MRIRLIFPLVFLFLLFLPQKAFAEVIHSFDTKVMAHKDGSLTISEKIVYDFEQNSKHGIYRYVPLYSRVGDLYRILKVEKASVLRDGASEKFDESLGAEKIQFKIGNPNLTITGAHTYTISYKVLNGVGSNFSDHDEIYWNGTGNDWEVTIEKASIEISNDFGAKQIKLICFEGTFGSKDQTCSIDNQTATSNRALYSGYGLSAVSVYPVGTFPKSILSTSPPKTAGEEFMQTLIGIYPIIWVLLNIVIGPLALFKFYLSKNKKRFGPPVVNFDIPKDEKGDRLAPALAGTIDTAKLERNDVTATIFDLAIREYIRLEQNKTERKLLPDSSEQLIYKLKEDDGGLETFEKILFDRLFMDGDTLKVSSLKPDFYETFQVMEDETFATLIRRGYYTANPKTRKAVLIFLGFFSIFTFNLILGIVFLILARKFNGRTILGDEIDFKIDGLKLFLKSMDRNYKWQAEKFYTVEQMIPYAVSLGYINEFMEQLKIINPDYSPSWYAGTNFYASYSLFYSGMSSGVTTSAPSSSSGGGGGGSSGGGGGGGGGGSW